MEPCIWRFPIRSLTTLVSLLGSEISFQIFDFEKNLKGNFSSLSKTLALSTRAAGFFDGTCTRNE